MAETRLKVTYSVTSTTNSTQLFKTSYFSKAELADGTELPSNIFDVGNHAYVFSATGNNDVFYTMTGNTAGDEAFEGMTRIVAVDIPSTVTTLGERCFRNCTNLSSVTLADSVSNFGEGVFDADVALQSIVIPSTAVTMSDKVFRGCASLTSITMSDTTAPAVSADTFYQVQTGGTLYYPAGSDYSDWLSNNQYYLGYYNWNGVSGTGVQSLRSQALQVSSSGLIGTYDTTPANSVLAALRVLAVPFNSEPNIEWTIGHNDLNMTLCGNTVYDKGYTEETNDYVLCRNLVYFDSTIDGYTDIAIRETNTNLTTNLRVINRLPGSNATPSVLPEPSAVTFSSSGCNYIPAPLQAPVIANIVCNGFNPDSNFVDTPHFLQTPDRWEDDIVSRPHTDFVLRDGLVLRLQRLEENTGGSRYWELIRAYTPNTSVQITSGDKTTYVFKFHMNQESSGSTPTPSDRWMYLDPSGKTFSATDEGNYYFYVRSSGCSIDRSYTPTFTFSGDTSWINSISDVYSSSGRWAVRYRCSKNLGDSDREIYITVNGVHDTDGNVYNGLVYHATQAWGSYIYLEKGGDRVPSAGTIDTAQIVPVNTYVCFATLAPFDVDLIPENLWEGVEQPTLTISGNNLTVVWPENPHAEVRSISARMNVVWGERCENETYLNYAKLQEAAPAPPTRWMYLDPSATTISASGNGTYTFYVRGSGCSIDDSYTPTFTFSGDTSWINSISSVTFSSGRWSVAYYSPRNLGNSNREVYITVNGVHDTDGNVYDDLVYHVTQNYGSYVFLNYDEDHNAPSGSSVETVEVVPVNTTVCSISVTSSSTTPDLWVGVARPTVTILGNYITVNWPKNPYPTNRNYQLSVVVVWGESCENTTTLIFNKNQNAGPTPVQKDIKATNTSYSVGSGSGNASTTVQTTGCTYDHFTYITGGSFSVTATSGPNNTIVFTYPQNPTTSPRTGYVYITFYDSDGNAYGPQTIFFTQQAGSSPGPGPGPDPETGYVLTSITITDHEQHRYFVEARPGIVYSAAGQYYKTIPACEARYSLYYVNSYGGVDVLPFRGGGQKKTDNITRFNYSRSFRNNTPEFENVNYMNEIKAVWELQTGWIGDDGSSRMHELVESTIVYLYDAEEKTYTPVVMTDKKLEYKTYRNQGRKFYNYTVNVEESQSKERR